MKLPTPDAPLRCPRCGSAIERIPRRWIDRFRSLFGTVHRYRCFAPACRWEGNLRARGFAPMTRERRYDRRIDAP